MSFHWALKACRLYGVAHPRYLQVLSGLEGGYQRFLEGKAQVQIAARSGKIFVDKMIEDAQNLQVKVLASELEERGVHALLLYPGATREELQALINIMCMKPGQIRELGGAKKLLEEKSVQRIRILAVRLEDVSESGEISVALLESVAGFMSGMPKMGGQSPSAPGERVLKLPEAPSLPSPAAASGGRQAGDPNSMAAQVRAYFLAAISAGGAAPDLAGFGSLLQGLGMDQQGVQPGTQGAVRQSLASLAPEQQVELFRGAAQMRSGPLRNLFSRLASTMAIPSFAASFAHGSISPEHVAEIAEQIRPLASNLGQFAEQLVDALQREGLSQGQLRELVDILTWESLPMDAKLTKLLEGNRIFEMPVEKVLAFLRELLEAGRNQEFLRVTRHYANGLVAPAVARRVVVAKGFEKISDWVDIPGMPSGLIDELMERLSLVYGREKDPEVHQWISKAVEHILWFKVESGDPARAYALFGELQDVVTEVSLPAPWKIQATEELLSRLGAPDRINKVLAQLFTLDRQDAAARIHPYLRMLGPSAANYLVERLADEPDRVRRAHLLEALKSCGQVAEVPLLESLKSDEWFVVRNSLIVLAEIAGPGRLGELIPLLGHPDHRVVGAAIRTVGRIGGRSAESALVPLLFHRDPSTQMEALFILGEMKSKQAVPALLDLVKNSKGKARPEQEKVREKAVELLGQLETASVVPTLEELLIRRRSFFRETKEPLSMRLAALRALIGLNAMEAQEAVRRVLEAEPRGPEKDALNAALTEALGSRPARTVTSGAAMP
jgi:HEAT repeat protein